MQKYDVIIIGGACAGLTAGLYSSRRALSTLIISKDIGGQAAITTEIENYPGVEKVAGPILMTTFNKQAKEAGAEFKLGVVESIEKFEDGFKVKTNIGEFESLAVILAFGLEQRKLNVPGEKELIGRGVAYCATCDGPLYKNRIVGVVGSGNSAFDAAEYLSGIAEKVYLFTRNDKYGAEETLISAVHNRSNIEIKNFTEVKEIIGENRLEKVILTNNQTNEETELNLDGLFVEVGWITKTDFVKDLVELDDYGHIKVDAEAKTSTPGVFAAGDVTNSVFKQVVISAGEGAKAALSAVRYIQDKKGQVIKKGDWTRIKKSN